MLSICCLFSFSTASFAAQRTDLEPIIRKILIQNPDIIFEAFNGHEDELYDILQIGLEKKNKSKILARRKQQLRNPKIAKPYPNRPIWGDPDSQISIIAFSDFQSASSSKADSIILKLLKIHPEINYRYRHNPLGLHKMSRTAALYYEALAAQDHTKAKNFNHLILENRLKVKKYGIKELENLAIRVGADMAKLKRDINSRKIAVIVDTDIKEAKNLGFTASPVFLVNGITVTGAASADEFEEVFHLLKMQSK
jgi:protein-disulfide isomerase